MHVFEKRWEEWMSLSSKVLLPKLPHNKCNHVLQIGTKKKKITKRKVLLPRLEDVFNWSSFVKDFNQSSAIKGFNPFVAKGRCHIHSSTFYLLPVHLQKAHGLHVWCKYLEYMALSLYCLQLTRTMTSRYWRWTYYIRWHPGSWILKLLQTPYPGFSSSHDSDAQFEAPVQEISKKIEVWVLPKR